MANYTICIYQLVRDKNFKIFNFDYKFYDDRLKEDFEKQFIDHFFLNEIGFETIGLFQQRLKTVLNDLYPKYKQLYDSELKAKDINFLLNKDLKESNERLVTSNKTDNTVSHGTTTTNINASNNDNIDYKESNIDNGNAYIGVTNGNLTSQSNNIKTSTANSDENVNSQMNVDNKTDNIEKEINTLISQGNIGITSSAELLQKWRDVMININLMLFNEIFENDLFMTVY